MLSGFGTGVLPGTAAPKSGVRAGWVARFLLDIFNVNLSFYIRMVWYVLIYTVVIQFILSGTFDKHMVWASSAPWGDLPSKMHRKWVSRPMERQKSGKRPIPMVRRW